MLEVEDHAELCTFVVCVALCLLYGHSGGFPDRHDVVAGEYPAVHFLKEFVHARTVAHVRVGVPVDSVEEFSVRIGLDLADHGNDVHSEPVNSLVAPPGHHIIDCIAHFRVFPVEIRLLL